YLQQKALSVVGKPFTLEHLTYTLFHISKIDKVHRTVIEAIRATAFLLEAGATSKTADTITKHVITAIAPHVTNILQASETLNTKIQHIEQP
ncbi:hypothetical protein PAXRUDRAFT_156768, partial [Paxillus rubicundulus Ve08.2h10]